MVSIDPWPVPCPTCATRPTPGCAICNGAGTVRVLPAPGATGRTFGPIDPTDQGELACLLTTHRPTRQVRLDFGKNVAWLSIPASGARGLGRLLIEKADELDAEPVM